MCGSRKILFVALCVFAHLNAPVAHGGFKDWLECLKDRFRLMGDDEADLSGFLRREGVPFRYSGKEDRMTEMAAALADYLHENKQVPELILRRYVKRNETLRPILDELIGQMKERGMGLIWSRTLISHGSRERVLLTTAHFGNEYNIPKLLSLLAHEVKHHPFVPGDFPIERGESFLQYYDRYMRVLEDDELAANNAEIETALRMEKLGYGKAFSLLGTVTAKEIYLLRKKFAHDPWRIESAEREVIRSQGDIYYGVSWKDFLKACWDANLAG